MALSMKVVKMLVIGLLLFCIISTVQGRPKSVSVTLDAKWGSTPLLLEASEYLAKENIEYFWRYISDVSLLKPEEMESVKDLPYYSMILTYAEKSLSKLQMSLLKLSMSLRIYSPAIENFNQMALHEPPPEKKNCDVFVSLNGLQVCSPKKIEKSLEEAKKRKKSAIYKFDHVYPGSDESDVPVVAVLYGELGKPNFRDFHVELRNLAMSHEVTYLLRHFVKNPSEQKTRLSGYGVELAIKSQEYKAKDDTKIEGDGTKEEDEVIEGEDEIQGFIFSKLKDLYPEKQDDLKQFRKHLRESSTELTALKVWQLQDLSLQAAQTVLLSEGPEALKKLQDISQNFPSVARTLVKVPVKNEMKKEIEKNQQYFENYHGISPGDAALYVNGLPIDIDVYDMFTFLDVMRSEAKLMQGLFSLGFKGNDLSQLMKLDLSGETENFALDIRHTAIQYINDLEKDKKYSNWPSSIQDLLRPTFPGMLRHVARNIFHLVFIVDPLDKESRELVKMAEAFIVHSAPIRVAVVFVTNDDMKITGYDDAGVALSRAYDILSQEENPGKALSFVTDVYEKVKSGPIAPEQVVEMFQKKYKDHDFEMIFGSDDEYDTSRKAALDYVKRAGLKDFPQVLLNGVPLKDKYLTENTFEEGVVSEIMAQTPDIQKAVYNGNLHDGNNIHEWLMEKSNVLPRLNSRVLSPPVKTLDLTVNIDGGSFDDLDTFGLLNSDDMTAVMAENMKYMQRRDNIVLRAVTMWVVCDVETTEGRQLLYNAIKQLKHSHDLRVGVVFNTEVEEGKDYMISKAIYLALKTLDTSEAKNFITKLVKEENVKDLVEAKKTLRDFEVSGMDIDNFLSQLDKLTTNFLRVHRLFVRSVLGWRTEARGLVTNGKVIGAFDDVEEFTEEDIALQEKFVFEKGAKKIKERVMKMGILDERGSDMVMKVSALLSSKTSTTERKEISYHADQHSVLKILGDANEPAFQIEAIVDPVSSEAQKLAPILLVLKRAVNVDIKIFMNSRDKLSEMPLTTYYRYVLSPDVEFEPNAMFKSGQKAVFTGLPHKSVLTLGMKCPESWMVESVKALYDLDNILLEEVDSVVHAEFDLEYLLLEGHGSDGSSGQPPRGLQFTLGSNSTPMVDTIVMANLGYFQLKATPGLWYLRLREGRSREIYDITSHEHTDTPSDSDDVVISMNSFKSKIIRVKVEKKEDKKNEDLLKEPQDEEKGLWDSISSTLTGDKGGTKDVDQTLNIFSLASGLMYERLMRIMMMSVLKHTKSKVKFWFLKNYLSPSFKDFIPKMAENYGFEYELVQYKWPRWLNQQKEKQRIMWGYKILFLDVLFPLDVKKFIFVDADQIVRADLQELHDLDLNGAPYGYTPFCSDRKEMDGFRFWKSGYWASHLAGRKYHISALYVVDLKKFRKIAAGDRLRGQYQGLSQDPNSLSNLDQDLPNNMIHQVSIKSLPQEWLWCATWCSDESKAKAKTIDLCNNPLTKEPKLKAALRIAPEWKEYDYEIKVLWDKIYGTNTRSQLEYEAPKIDTKEIGAKLGYHDEL
ncbi:UDP-glucose:glycoprotein glucosyltransferase 1-like [Mytilus californianus]|uniref:UDP-glucose:glycoprotein glucosyltransferase 1-like n=1 Tax=Mytilus californianus TaxID=6549 RepID=UPI00224617E7|nr:UDP-glucose:glycoprotein glucosyltransferase 1-like [Mytilus californianus]